MTERADEEASLRRTRRSSGKLPPSVEAYGFTGSSSWTGVGEPFGLVYPPVDAAADEVRILAETVEVRDGVLRGLVRNWSRQLWAYDMTVIAEDLSFMWPLSIQPGEVAPFEIAGWSASADPKQIEFAVTAEMSLHADMSRAFRAGHRPTLWAQPETRRLLPAGLRDSHPGLTADVGVDSVSLGIVAAEFVLDAPASHPSLSDDIDDPVIGDLRAYGAVFDSQGRVVELSPAEVIAAGVWLPDLLKQSRDAEGGVSLHSLPHADYDARHGVSVVLDVHTPHAEVEGDRRLDASDDADPYWSCIESMHDQVRCPRLFEGGFIVWIGGANPARSVLER
ncbi:hypothetical protein [Candidatus Poriferisodalis sp.]|uniref:hypothetical protein n=1 Tax=Candidatus Poriferisodalis sp. TaxID=3101277 RepID=UPI003B02E453